MFSLTRKALMLGCACVLAFSSTTSMVLAEEFQVKLIATIDNGPALEKVKWTVYRNGTEKVTEANRHLARVKVPPGNYTAVAKLTKDNKTVTRSRSFFVRNNTRVVVPMDH